ncbi:hypothetical protein [Kaistia terrae]|uniref:Replication protein n=1 Tax=Kaistia terrae TaxID=537017 RepID=A0ABW0PZG7_9HYPH|nr:hypothetical protein [Kaistia terrae]MCX5579112.1 hypothetical protein [Kaistia terrae]
MSTAIFSARDRSRTSGGKTFNMVRKHTSPPRKSDGFDKGADSSRNWAWLTIEIMESVAFRSLSGNATKALFRLVIEHTMHAGLKNGRLVVTHGQFSDYGVTGEYVADAIDELEYKGLIKIDRGRAGIGTPHANVFTITYLGDYEGAAPTGEWRRCTPYQCKQWSEVDRKKAAAGRGKVGRKKKTPLRDSEILPLRNSEILEAS